MYKYNYISVPEQLRENYYRQLAPQSKCGIHVCIVSGIHAGLIIIVTEASLYKLCFIKQLMQTATKSFLLQCRILGCMSLKAVYHTAR